MKLEQSDLDAIAEAVAAKLKASPDAPKSEPETKPAGKNKPAGKAKGDEPTIDRNAVLELARKVRADKGADVAKGIIAEYGESFKDVEDKDLAALQKKLQAKLDEEDDV